MRTTACHSNVFFPKLLFKHRPSCGWSDGTGLVQEDQVESSQLDLDRVMSCVHCLLPRIEFDNSELSRYIYLLVLICPRPFDPGCFFHLMERFLLVLSCYRLLEIVQLDLLGPAMMQKHERHIFSTSHHRLTRISRESGNSCKSMAQNWHKSAFCLFVYLLAEESGLPCSLPGSETWL